MLRQLQQLRHTPDTAAAAVLAPVRAPIILNGRVAAAKVGIRLRATRSAAEAISGRARLQKTEHPCRAHLQSTPAISDRARLQKSGGILSKRR